MVLIDYGINKIIHTPFVDLSYPFDIYIFQNLINSKNYLHAALFTLNDSKFLKDRLESKKNNRSTCTIERTNVDAEIKCVHGRVISNYIIYMKERVKLSNIIFYVWPQPFLRQPY